MFVSFKFNTHNFFFLFFAVRLNKMKRIISMGQRKMKIQSNWIQKNHFVLTLLLAQKKKKKIS